MSVFLLHTRILSMLPALFQVGRSLAQSPADLPLHEGNVTHIECQWDREEALPGFDPDKKPQRGLWHYDLFVPDGYLAQKQRRYPCLFVSSPGGEARHFLGLYKGWLAQHEWLAVMLAESRNGPIEPCLGNFLSAHDDAVGRLRIIETMKAAAGMSGAARMSSLYVQVRPGFRGLFLQGAGFSQSTLGRYWMHRVPADGSLSVFLTLGKNDPNLTEAEFLRDALPPGVPYFPRLFDGGHVPPAENVAAQGMDWLERQMWLGAVADKSARAEIPALVKRLAAKCRDEISPVARHALLRNIAELVKAYRLASHAEIAAMLPELSKHLSALKTDPAVVLETKADTALAAMRERQRQITAKVASLKDAGAKSSAWLDFCAACATMAELYPGTRSGEECRLLAEGLAP